MFKKQFKVKSNNLLKGSERKKLLTRVSQAFPSLKGNDISDIFPLKEPVICLKLLTSSGLVVSVFKSADDPVALEVDGKIYPTIFLLWRYPGIAYTFTTNSFVMHKLMSGADLMLAGVSKHGSLSDSNIRVQKNDVVSINTDDNDACFAVGHCLMDSHEIEAKQNHGKVVQVIHIFKDELCTYLKPNSQQPQIKCPPINLPDLVPPLPSSEIVTHLAEGALTEAPMNSDNGMTVEIDSSATEPKENSQFENMDDTLKYCFLAGLKLALKHGSFPILTNIFYRKFMVEACPSTDNLDVKKSSYKKLSVFLNEMSSNGIITLETSSQDVQSILSINPDHELLCHFRWLKVVDEGSNKADEKTPLSVKEKFVVNAACLPLFSTLGYKKGNEFLGSDVRKAVKSYVEKENLKDPAKKELVILDPILAHILNTNDDRMPWDQLNTRLTKLMGLQYEIVHPSGEVVCGKGVAPSIQILVCTRANSKKVTLVSNLDLYGININEFSAECQRGTAASATTNTNPGNKKLQLQIQGNQIKFILKLLTEKYLIPKKYISYDEASVRKKK